MAKKLLLGKVPSHILASLLRQLPPAPEEVLIPPGIGLDAAALKIGDRTIVVTTDPITFTDKHVAKYSVAVNINDIACMGCRPRWFTSTLILPEGTTDVALHNLWHELTEELKRYDITAIGGHIEVSNKVNSPILVGQMMGEPVTEKLLDPRNAKPGDRLLLWRCAALEGTALLATERYVELSDYILPAQLDTMRELLDDPGICIWPAAEKLFALPGLIALHDPTEGGVATALHELADSAGSGLTVNRRSIPILSETLQLADILKFNPLGMLASGSLLIVCKKSAEKAILDCLKDERIASIGELTESQDRLIIEGGQSKTLPRFDQDEIVNALTRKI